MSSADTLFVKGLTNVSCIDYPGRIAVMLFTAGCNFRCGYCHNPSLISSAQDAFEPFASVRERLVSRRALADGVVITGGEPTIHDVLPSVIEQIHALGFPVKLDTNASMPSVLEQCLPFLDYIAVDIKTSLRRYDHVCRLPLQEISARIERSLELLRTSGKSFEIRITASPDIVDAEAIEEMLPMLVNTHVHLQQFSPAVTLDESYRSLIPYPPSRLETFAARIRTVAAACTVR
ncbi:MAG: anaerobic ribonucleoside-triphosphate reductase activating protein [Spirochaetes bacterium]|nr:anaerobic ribonucleoside-triphosphate reductase activating protein [Spirochaetota bacterium]